MRTPRGHIGGVGLRDLDTLSTEPENFSLFWYTPLYSDPKPVVLLGRRVDRDLRGIRDVSKTVCSSERDPCDVVT